VPKRTVFISYSHKDEAWKDRLVTHLAVLQGEGLIDVWDDRQIGAGEDWKQQIIETIESARVALLLVSADYLASSFIRGTEVPLLLDRAKTGGVVVFPVIIRPCRWQDVGWLASKQVRPKDGKPVIAGNEYEIETNFAEIAKETTDLVRQADRVASPAGLRQPPPNMPASQRRAPQEEALEFIRQLKSEDSYVRREAVKRLEYLGLYAVPPLIAALSDAHPNVRRLSAEALGKIGPNAREAIPLLTAALRDDNPQIRQSLAEALGKIGRGSESPISGLTIALDDGVVNVRRSAVQALAKVGPQAVPVLTKALEDDDVDVRQLAADGLGRLGQAAISSSAALVATLRDSYEDVRSSAADALERIGPDAMPALQDALATADEASRGIIASVLDRIHLNPALARPVVHGRYPSEGDVFDGTYSLRKQIGDGSEARIYKAKLLKPMPLLGLDEGDPVIVKYYHPRKLSDDRDQAELERWFRGYRLTKDNPPDGLRRVLEYREYWIAVLQWVPGEPLSDLIARRTGETPGQVELQELVTNFLRVLDAIIQLNHQGLVFRDLKPQNIIVTESLDHHQAWTLIDTGLVTQIAYDGASSLTTSETILGTPLYGAPELIDSQARYPKDSEAVDIYSVGSTLYKIVTGMDMFSGGLAMIFRKKLEPDAHDLYLRPDALNTAIDEELSRIIQGCLRFRPDDRYQRLQLVYNDLKRWLQQTTPSRTSSVERSYDAFISYASPDRRAAEALFDGLSPTHRMFLDNQRLMAGGRWPDEIRDAQARSRMTIALLSRYTSQAQHQVEEIRRGIALAGDSAGRHRIVPIYLDSIVPPYGLDVYPSLSAVENDSIPIVIGQLMKLMGSPSQV